MEKFLESSSFFSVRIFGYDFITYATTSSTLILMTTKLVIV